MSRGSLVDQDKHEAVNTAHRAVESIVGLVRQAEADRVIAVNVLGATTTPEDVGGGQADEAEEKQEGFHPAPFFLISASLDPRLNQY